MFQKISLNDAIKSRELRLYMTDILELQFGKIGPDELFKSQKLHLLMKCINQILLEFVEVCKIAYSNQYFNFRLE